jgi:hypothetical protein
LAHRGVYKLVLTSSQITLHSSCTICGMLHQHLVMMLEPWFAGYHWKG